MYDRILIPLDGSDLAETAIPHATGLAERFQSQLFLLQVITTSAQIAAAAGPGDAMTPTGIDVIEQVIEEDMAEGRAYLEKTAGDLKAKGFKVEWDVVQGNASEEIVRWAHEHDVELIAIATHGRSGLSRLVMGSVADEVLRNGHLPVLLIAAK